MSDATTPPSTTGGGDASVNHLDHIVTNMPKTSTVFQDKTKKKVSVRHAEKRRTATCHFADRVGQISVEHYRKYVPKEHQSLTCLSTIVAHNKTDDTLAVLGMGVGTKFLPETILRQEINSKDESCYGRRVRDCHAEVLARRAFRRTVTLEIQRHLNLEDDEIMDSSSATSSLVDILTKVVTNNNTGNVLFTLKPGMTLHMYASSAPCGNATLKKFAKMQKERFRDDLACNEWPTEQHAHIHDSSIKLGQFALLVKKDNSCPTPLPENPIVDAATTTDSTTTTTTMALDSSDLENEKKDSGSTRKRPNSSMPQDEGASSSSSATKIIKVKQKLWPAMLSDDWCPPGTSIVTMNKGSIHSCSDKLGRWNILGLQGSFLSSLLESPLFLSTLTVGRKFTECICRRAVCCRLVEAAAKCKKRTKDKKHQEYHDVPPATALPGATAATAATTPMPNRGNSFRLNHPAILGTSVYMHEGAVETQNNAVGQDVRFHSSFSWAWWPSPNDMNSTADNGNSIECIDGSTGFSVAPNEYNSPTQNNGTVNSQQETISQISTYSLSNLFLETQDLIQQQETREEKTLGRKIGTLDELHQWKVIISPEYEEAKETLCETHRVFRHWRRRVYFLRGP